ncbi:hypothetical protein D3C73_986930 [compost metagenome]
MCERANRRVGRDAAGPDLFSAFFNDRKRPDGFLRARTLSQKNVISERIYRLVFCAGDVLYNRSACMQFIPRIITKRRADPSLLVSLANRGHRGARSLANIDCRRRPASGRTDPRLPGSQWPARVDRGQRRPGGGAHHQGTTGPGDPRPDASR